MAFMTTNLVTGVIISTTFWCNVVDQFRLFADGLDHFS
jgi:hypothetical protein